MSERDDLLARLAELEQAELGKEQRRLVARLLAIRVAASELAAESEDADVIKSANLVEEACQHAERLQALASGA